MIGPLVFCAYDFHEGLFSSLTQFSHKLKLFSLGPSSFAMILSRTAEPPSVHVP